MDDIYVALFKTPPANTPFIFTHSHTGGSVLVLYVDSLIN